MKKILIITAHPKTDSLTFGIADKYKTISKKNENEVEVVNLYQEEMQQPFFTYTDNPNKIDKTKEMEYFQSKISKADELVFVFPYWWGGMPAILKNFLDWNFSSGFAFEYTERGVNGLLKGKEVKVFTTAGAPSLLYSINGAKRRLKKTFEGQIIKFCGMKLTSFKLYGSVFPYSKKISKILDSIK